MNKLNNAFSGGKAFIPFITAGDPSLALTEALIYAMADAGADLIEIGIPFSDPIAEGLVIQAADERALASGTTTDGIFDMVKRIRIRCSVPLAFMTYYNPIFVYGKEKFLGNCHLCGIDAVIVPDLPFEEKAELFDTCHKNDVRLISLIAPTSDNRIQEIAKEAEGFLYCVSSLGVTGVRESIQSDVQGMIANVRKVSAIPCAVGFGVSTPEQAAAISRYADGVIVGSAIVKMVGQYGKKSVGPVAEYVKGMKQATSI